MVDGIVEIYRLWNPSGNANCAQIHAGGYLRRIFGSLARKGCVSCPRRLSAHGTILLRPWVRSQQHASTSLLGVGSAQLFGGQQRGKPKTKHPHE